MPLSNSRPTRPKHQDDTHQPCQDETADSMQGPRSTPAPAPSPAAPRRPPYQTQGSPHSQIPQRGRRCDRVRACTAAASTAPSCESYSSGTASATHTGGRPPSSISSTSAARAVRLRAAAPHAHRRRSMGAGRWCTPVVGGSSRPAARQRAFSRAAQVRQESVPSHHRRTVDAPVAATPSANACTTAVTPHPPLLDTARQCAGASARAAPQAPGARRMPEHSTTRFEPHSPPRGQPSGRGAAQSGSPAASASARRPYSASPRHGNTRTSCPPAASSRARTCAARAIGGAPQADASRAGGLVQAAAAGAESCCDHAAWVHTAHAS